MIFSFFFYISPTLLMPPIFSLTCLVFFFPFSPAMKDSFPPLVHLFLSFFKKNELYTKIHVARWVFFFLLYSPEASCVHLFHWRKNRCVYLFLLLVLYWPISCFFYKLLRAFHFYFEFLFLSKR